MQQEPTVFVVDDDWAIRDALTCMLEVAGHHIETFTNADDFLREFDASRPGCVLLDVHMPGMDGLELQKRLADRGSQIPVIMLTAHANVPMAVAAMRQGAVDFVEKPFGGEDLLHRIQMALQCDAARRDERAECAEVEQRLATLSPREREVLEQMVEGKTTKQIAAQIGTSHNTVRNQRASLMKKMMAAADADLVRMIITTLGEDFSRSPVTPR